MKDSCHEFLSTSDPSYKTMVVHTEEKKNDFSDIKIIFDSRKRKKEKTKELD